MNITNNLAVAYSERAQTSKAVRYARSALGLIETAGTHRYQLAVSVYRNAAGVLRNAGHRKEADDLEVRGAMAQVPPACVGEVEGFVNLLAAACIDSLSSRASWSWAVVQESTARPFTASQSMSRCGVGMRSTALP